MDSREMVLRCLEHLEGVDRVIVVDNASSDGTAAAVEERHPEVELVRLDAEQSLAAAYNIGAAAGDGDRVLFLNDDILADPHAVARLGEALDGDSGAVCAAGRLVDAETGETQREYLPRPFPGVGRFAAGFAGLDRIWPANRWTAPHADRALDGSTIPVDQPAGACLLVRRSAFDEVGGWDPAFELWFEDTDFARRLSEVGRILFVPRATFRHVGGHSTRRLARAEVVRRSYGGALRYGEKHYDPARRITLGVLFGTAAAVRALLPGEAATRGVYREIFRAALRLIARR